VGGVSAGDAYLDVHSRLAGDFNRRLAAQVRNPAERAGQEASRHFGRKFAAGLAIGGAAIGVGLAKGLRLAVREVGTAVQRASDLNETLSKSEHIFGRNAKAIQKWSRGSVSAMGLTRNQAIGNAAAFGDMFRQLGLGLNPATTMSKRMVELSADLASFSNADITQVLEAQQSAFRGEYDALQRFIPNINAARVEQEALRLTHKKSAKDLTAAEKAQATYAIMLRDSSRAQGDFARTAGEQANQQRIAKARLEEISTTVGKFFLPGVLAGTRAVNSFLLPTLQELAERHGPRVEKVFTRIGKTFARSLQGVDLERFASQGVAKLEQIGPKVADVIDRIGKRLGEARSQVRPAAPEVSRLASALNLGGAALDFIGGHMDLVVKALPVLVAGFLAYKAAQALANLASVAQVALLPLQIAGNFTLAKANRALAASNREMAAGTATSTAAQAAANAAGKAGLLTSIRARAAAIGQAVAQRAIAVASRAWAAAQWLVNVALTANPIGLVIAAIALLVAGIVIAYKKSEIFRTIVHKVWDAVKGKVATAVNFILGLLRGWLNFQFAMVAGILHVMGKLPGPMGAPFRKAEEAVKKAKETVNTQLDKIQARVNRLRGKEVPINLKATFQPPPGFSMHSIVGAAAGRRITAGTTATADDVLIRVSKGETVVSAADSARPEFRSWARARGIPGFRDGGLVGGLPSAAAMQAAIDRVGEVVARGIERGFRLLIRVAAIPGLAAPASRNRSIVHQVFAQLFGWTGAQLAAADQLIMHESGYRNTAQNPTSTAYGMFQFLNSTWASTGIGKTSDPRLQAIAGGRYIAGRYGSPAGAWAFWQRHHWYDQGGRIPEDVFGVGRSGRTYGFHRDETVTPPGGTVELGPGSRRALARDIGDVLVAAGIGATYLDSRRAEQVLAGAAVANRRR
jgi:hypothetical protein